jgi:hypothetical protein
MQWRIDHSDLEGSYMYVVLRISLDDYLSRSSSGYLIRAATVIGVYGASFSKLRYCPLPLMFVEVKAEA